MLDFFFARDRFFLDLANFKIVVGFIVFVIGTIWILFKK